MACLWLAFAAICLGLFFTGGRGPLLRAKLRVGGLLLGFAAVSALGPSCFQHSCYKDDTNWEGDTDTDTVR